MLLDHSKLVDNRKESKENNTPCIFRDLMVKGLIEAVEASKTEYEGRDLRIVQDNVREIRGNRFWSNCSE